MPLALAVFIHDRWPFGRGPAVAPLSEGDDHRREVDALVGQPILRIAAWPLGNTHEAVRHELPQPRGENVGGNAQAFLKLGESRVAREGRVAKHKQAPAFARDLERARRRADLPIVASSKHDYMLIELLA